jgi:hypothetical protein
VRCRSSVVRKKGSGGFVAPWRCSERRYRVGEPQTAVNRRLVRAATLFTGAGKMEISGVRWVFGGTLPFECLPMVGAQRAGLSPELGWAAMTERSVPGMLWERRGKVGSSHPELVHLKASGGEGLEEVAVVARSGDGRAVERKGGGHDMAQSRAPVARM